MSVPAPKCPNPIRTSVTTDLLTCNHLTTRRCTVQISDSVVKQGIRKQAHSTMPTLKQEVTRCLVSGRRIWLGPHLTMISSGRPHHWFGWYLPGQTVAALPPTRAVDSHGGTAVCLPLRTTVQLGVSGRTRTPIAVLALSGRCHMSFLSAVSGSPHHLTPRKSVSDKLPVALNATINVDYV